MKHLTWISLKHYWAYGVWDILRTLLHSRKNWRRKLERFFSFTRDMLLHGYTESDLWSLDCTIVEFVLPRLEWFRNSHGGIPMNLTEEEYEEILDKMLFAFRAVYRSECGLYDDPADAVKVQEGFELFGEYFQHLWN